MLCLNSFELYSRWVPLQQRILFILADSSYTPVLTPLPLPPLYKGNVYLSFTAKAGQIRKNSTKFQSRYIGHGRDRIMLSTLRVKPTKSNLKLLV